MQPCAPVEPIPKLKCCEPDRDGLAGPRLPPCPCPFPHPQGDQAREDMRAAADCEGCRQRGCTTKEFKS